MRHRCGIFLVASALIGSYAIAGCSDRGSRRVQPVAESAAAERERKALVSSLDDFAKRLADKQAKDKAKAGKKCRVGVDRG